MRSEPSPSVQPWRASRIIASNLMKTSRCHGKGYRVSKCHSVVSLQVALDRRIHTSTIEISSMTKTSVLQSRFLTFLPCVSFRRVSKLFLKESGCHDAYANVVIPPTFNAAIWYGSKCRQQQCIAALRASEAEEHTPDGATMSTFIPTFLNLRTNAFRTVDFPVPAEPV